MIKAVVSAVIPRAGCKGAFGFVKSRVLVSPENLDGSALFYLKPPFWTHSTQPRVGQSVLVGEVRKVMRPDWKQPRWRAFAVTPVPASPRRQIASPVVVDRATPTFWSRLFGALGFPAAQVRQRAAN